MSRLKKLFEEAKASKVGKVVYQEENDSTVQMSGKEYKLNTLFKLTADYPITQFKVNDLKWVLEFCDTKGKRKNNADLTAPILVTREKDLLVVVDGAHRLAKAVDKGVAELPGRFIEPAFLPFSEIGSHWEL